MKSRKSPDTKVVIRAGSTDSPVVHPKDDNKAADTRRNAAPAYDPLTDQSGTEGFSSQLAGHGKAGRSHTSSFKVGIAYSSGNAKDTPVSAGNNNTKDRK